MPCEAEQCAVFPLAPAFGRFGEPPRAYHASPSYRNEAGNPVARGALAARQTRTQTLGRYLTLAQKRNPIDGLVCLYWTTVSLKIRNNRTGGNHANSHRACWIVAAADEATGSHQGLRRGQDQA